jgi:glycosyltransferase involved in cell wall biosynthesis
MRVLIIHNRYQQRGGEESVVESEIDLLRQHGHEVITYLADSHDIKEFNRFQKGAMLARIPYSRHAASSLSRFVEQHKPDVAHVHNVFPLLTPSAYTALKDHQIPVVQTVHNFRFLCPNGLFYTHDEVCEDCQSKGYFSAVRRRCVRDNRVLSLLYAAAVSLAWRTGNWPNNINRFITLSRFSSKKLEDAGVPAGRIKICENFVTTFAEKPGIKRPYALYLGRLSREKGLMTLLRAAAIARDIPLIIAGTGPLEAELREFVQQNALSHVSFAGFVTGTDKLRLLREAAYTVVPSEWYEMFAIAVAESLANATPVIASRIGSLPEIVEHGLTGLLFKPGDEQELATCLRTILTKKTQCERMAQQALVMARSRLSPERHYASLNEVYREAIQGRAHASN